MQFGYSQSGRKISFLEITNCRSGWLTINKLSNESFETEEHLLITALYDDGTEMEGDMVNRIMGLPATGRNYTGNTAPEKLTEVSARAKEIKLREIEEQNKKYFLEECEKLDAWSEDRKSALQQDIKDMDKLIKEKNRSVQLSANDCSLEKIVDKQSEILKLKKLRERKRRELFEEEDKIEQENEKLQEEMRLRLKGQGHIENIFTIRFEIL